MEPTKRCKTCNVRKPINQFRIRPKFRKGIECGTYAEPNCHGCVNRIRREAARKARESAAVERKRFTGWQGMDRTFFCSVRPTGGLNGQT